MIHYELMYIIDPAAEDGVDAVKQKIEGIITGREGTILSYERLGKKHLAYPIAKRQFGVYYLVNLKGDGRIVQAVDQFLLLNPITLRHIILAFTDKDLGLREATERIQLEEAERMRMGGRPLTSKGEGETGSEDGNGSMPSEVKAAIDAIRNQTEVSSFYPKPVESPPVGARTSKSAERPAGEGERLLKNGDNSKE